MNRKIILCSLFIGGISLAIAPYPVAGDSPLFLVVTPPRRLSTPPPNIVTIVNSRPFGSSLLQWMLLPYLGFITLVWKLSCSMRSAVVVSQRSPGRLAQFLGTENSPINGIPLATSGALVSDRPSLSVKSQPQTILLAAQSTPTKQLQITPDRLGYAHVQWDIADVHQQALKNQGGKHLMLRIQDVTDLNRLDDIPLSVQTYVCAETDREKYVAIPVSDHDYIAELGYFTEDYCWLSLHQSDAVRIPGVAA